MRLTYKIQRTSTSDVDVLKEKIVKELNKMEYDIAIDSSNIISFELTGWGSRNNQFNKVNGGIFEIYLTESVKIITFCYYVSINFELLVVPAFLLLGFFVAKPFLYLSIALFMGSIIRLNVAKSKCQEQLEQIVA